MTDEQTELAEADLEPRGGIRGYLDQLKHTPGRRAQLTRLMAKPYGRVVVLHVAIIAGGVGAALLGSPVWALALLVLLKTGLDYRAHVKEHSRA